MNKKILISLSVIGIVAAIAVGGTIAYFSDTETSEGNILTAGSIDLKVDHTLATYNGEHCSQDCLVMGDNLIYNHSFEAPTVADNNGDWELFETIPEWDNVSDAKIELQGSVFSSADGNQHLELDSDPQGNSASAIEQTFETVAGKRYQLAFAWSPRPESQSYDSEVVLDVELVSVEGQPLSETIVSGSGSINWQDATYEFIALGSETTLRFSHGGPENTYGGLIDNVRVREMECEIMEEENWTCELWELKNLDNEKFFNFDDVKPGDWGTNVISYHVFDNDAHVCMIIDDVTEEEVDPKLAGALNFLVWEDDGYGNYDSENELYEGPIVGDWRAYLGDVVGSTDNYVGLFWCAGEIVKDGNDLSCDGSEMGNEYQGAEMLADLIFYAEQSRHNTKFSCDDWGEEVQEQF